MAVAFTSVGHFSFGGSKRHFVRVSTKRRQYFSTFFGGWPFVKKMTVPLLVLPLQIGSNYPSGASARFIKTVVAREAFRVRLTIN